MQLYMLRLFNFWSCLFIFTMCYPGFVVSQTPESQPLGTDQFLNRPIHAPRSIGRTSRYIVGMIEQKLQHERNAAPATINPTTPIRESGIRCSKETVYRQPAGTTDINHEYRAKRNKSTATASAWGVY